MVLRIWTFNLLYKPHILQMKLEDVLQHVNLGMMKNVSLIQVILFAQTNEGMMWNTCLNNIGYIDLSLKDR